MQNKEWILLDTETTGLATPIFVVELGARRMRGWEPERGSFRRLLNHGVEIPPEASRKHGYTREILERDGEPPLAVYRDFASYVGDRPLVAYNLRYDLDDVLVPEWRRLGVAPIGDSGFCALKLAQRLLDPVPAGNCQLQTLRQFYRLPERGAHTAMGDVDTVIDLMREVLKPLAVERGLSTWDRVRAFADSEWYPSRLAFGKFKGRDFRDARDDQNLRGWLSWLSESANERSARMGRWYLSRLAEPGERGEGRAEGTASASGGSAARGRDPVAADRGVPALHQDLEIKRLQAMVEAARARLAELEAAYTADRSAVDAVRAAIFNRLRDHYRARDRIQLIVEYRRRYLDTLLREGEERAEAVAEEYHPARDKADADYEEAVANAADTKSLSDEEKKELNVLWRELVKLFHPDRYAGDAEKRVAYERLISVINDARDRGDFKLLQDIAADPSDFIARQGLGTLDLEEETGLEALERLLESLQLRIVDVLEELNALRESPDFELFTLTRDNPRLIDEIAEERKAALSAETEELRAEAARLQREIDELAGAKSRKIG